MGEIFTLSKANKSCMEDLYYNMKQKLIDLQFDHSCIGVNSVL